jgi:ABC-type phosphate transport system substrate-binding protein
MVFRLFAFIVVLLVFKFEGKTQTLSDYKIIGNSTGVVSLTEAEVKSYFKGKYTLWKTGKSVKVVLHSSQSKHSSILAKLIFNTSQQGVQKYWMSLVFQGRANPPVFLDSDVLIAEYVAKTPGSIGIIHGKSSIGNCSLIQIK